MKLRHFWPGILIMGLLLVVLMASISAAAAANTVPASRLDSMSQGITLDDFIPTECTMTIENVIVSNAGTINGTNQNDLILAGTGNNNIRGRGGDDCILGGGGNDTINGGVGYNVCFGGPGTDNFTNCDETYQ